MKLNIKELLDFFDDKKGADKGDATAISSILGEDLNAAAYKHFRNNEVIILNESVLPGGLTGNRLDRWIFDEKNKQLYQCEIKNWAASAIGGKQLKTDASDENIKIVSEYHWVNEQKNSFSKNTSQPNGVSKVLLPMRPPVGYENLKIEPLLIYWMPITSDEKGLKPLSSITTFPFKTKFSKLYIFSVSLYLRELMRKGEKNINLDMPNFERRMKILNKLLK